MSYFTLYWSKKSFDEFNTLYSEAKKLLLKLFETFVTRVENEFPWHF